MVALETRGWMGDRHGQGEAAGRQAEVEAMVGRGVPCEMWLESGWINPPASRGIFYMRAGARLKTRLQGPYSACKGSCCA